jgi:hypothetical protein
VNFPLRYARQNLLLGPGGEAAALYRLPTVSYPFLPVGEKWRWLRTLERLATVVGADFSLHRVSRAYPAERYRDRTRGLLDPTGQDSEVFDRFLRRHEQRLWTLNAFWPEVYLTVALGSPEHGRFGASLADQFGRGRRRLEDLAGVGRPQPIPDRELRTLAAVEQRTFQQLAAVIGCRRASTRELEWLLRRSPLRGVGEPELDGRWQPDALMIQADDGRVAYEPLGVDLVETIAAPLNEPRTGPARLVIETEQGDAHQAFLTVGALADEAEFPGPAAELLFAPLESAGFPVDAVLHARWIGNRQALGQVRKRIVDVEQVFREEAEGSPYGPGLVPEEDRALAREYEAILQSSGHPPMLRASISLAVGAENADDLERRVATLRDQFGAIRLHRPRGLQEALFLDHLPQPGGGRVRDYVGQMTVEQFGALMPIGTDRLGSDRGIYLGTTPARRPVTYDPTAPSRESRASAVLLAGTLGSGKTVAAQAIAYAAERRGSLVVDLDPKPDHGLHLVDGLDGRVQVLELSADPEHRGKLDPLRIGLPDLREELACSYYLELLRDPPPSWEHQIQRAVRDLVTNGARSSVQVIERLRSVDRPAANDAADALEVACDFGLARLGFADDRAGDAGLGGPGAPVTTIRTPGLTLPDPRASRETYSRAERISVATLSLVAAYALRLVSGDRSRHKVVLLDEAWFLLASSQGRNLVNRLVRLGRAFNATVLLATQRLEDLGDLSDLVGTYLIFGQESDAEAARALHLLGLDPEDQGLIARVRGFRQGRCLMRDLDGRVGELQVDVDPQLLAALDTAPNREERS